MNAMKRFTLLIVAAGVALGPASMPSAQARRYALESTQGLKLHNVTAEARSAAGQEGAESHTV
jgi:hypothetical protein